MKRIIVLFLLGMIIFGGCKKKEEEAVSSYIHISQEEAKRIMDEEDDIVILDVRTKEEYDGGHIKDAICIPNETIDEKVSETLKDKNQKILVYCRSGRRSVQAAEKLVALGYTKIYEFGGIIDWIYGVE
ncbi:MAG: rhodanese-like domain-containing protein [Erysipelotrichaceae bacterium]|nr:rhodanese-like domain-containing protein [Erysipelotrichaceae bacterium]